MLLQPAKVHEELIKVLRCYPAARIYDLYIKVYVVDRVLSLIEEGVIDKILIGIGPFGLELRGPRWLGGLRFLLSSQNGVHSDGTTLRGELDSIRQEVEEDLHVPVLIAIYRLKEEFLFLFEGVGDDNLLQP